MAYFYTAVHTLAYLDYETFMDRVKNEAPILKIKDTNQWVVSDIETNRAILKSSQVSSKRNHLIGRLAEYWGEANARDFFSHWALYEDGEKHSLIRRSLIQNIRDIQNSVHVSTTKSIRSAFYTSGPVENHLSLLDIRSAVLEQMSYILGIPASQFSSAYKGVLPVLKLLHGGNSESNRNELLKSKEIWNSFLYENGKHITYSTDNDSIVSGRGLESLILPFFDTVEAITGLCASQLIYDLNRKFSNNNLAYSELNFWPFRTINRTVTKPFIDLPFCSGDIISCLISIPSEPPLTVIKNKTPLVFGTGFHSCLGTVISTEILKHIISQINNITANYQGAEISYKISSRPFHQEFEYLNIKFL